MAASSDTPNVEGQLGFFDTPESDPVEAPKTVRPSKTPPKYTNLAAKQFNCMDCERLVYEQIRERGNSTHLIRKARVRRTAGNVEDVLCHEHATLRKESDAAPRKRK